MKNSLIAEASISIDAPAAAVWKAITDPELIARYLYGTKVKSDWKEGGEITYEGEHNGTKYHDKGVIKKLETNKVFASTYWSSMGGKEDKPENYNLVTYTLTESDGKTEVMLTQDNVADEKEKEHAAANWSAVLTELKKIAESL